MALLMEYDVKGVRMMTMVFKYNTKRIFGDDSRQLNNSILALLTSRGVHNLEGARNLGKAPMSTAVGFTRIMSVPYDYAPGPV